MIASSGAAAILFLSSLGFAFAGYVALCVTTRAQARQLWSESWRPARIHAVRALGYALLALSCVAWMMSQGAAMGFASWLFCVLPLAALPLIFAWPYGPRRLIALGLLCVPLAAMPLMLS